MEKLAIHGGTPVKTTPYTNGQRYGEEELKQLKEALEQNTLFYWSGNKAKSLQKKFSSMCGVPYCVTTSSGTAAIHVALGALEIGLGDEVITTPLTDMGTIIGIVFQNAVPVFADVDPNTYNMDPVSIESKITERTKAILVVHLSGNACDMDAIMDIAKRHNLKVIEDCAQAYCCYYKGKLVGTIGDVGCFSLNEFKHISAGDGGMCIMKDEQLYRKAGKFADKSYDRLSENIRANITHIGINYRMNELTAAVGLAQLDKVEDICDKCNKYGDALSRGISDLPGIYPHKITDGCKPSYWWYMFVLNEEEAGVSRDEFCDALSAEGIFCEKGCGASYCVCSMPLFKNKEFYPGTNFPFNDPFYDNKDLYSMENFPNMQKVIDTGVKLLVKSTFSDQDLEDTIAAIRKVSEYYSNR